MAKVAVLPVPCLSDNYAYLVYAADADRREAVVVDPSDAEPILGACREAGLRLTAILATHHHDDHVGGIADLQAAVGPMPVLGSTYDRHRLPGITRLLGPERPEGPGVADGFTVGGLEFQAFNVPGHTLGAIAYLTDDALFTGDTLFGAGCGRLFEGTADMMHASLALLGRLQPECRVYFGHEYTESNLRFAAHIEPDNTDIHARLAEVRQRRARGEATTPSSIDVERRTNPFLRCEAESILRQHEARHGRRAAGAEVFATLRRRKDHF